MRYLLVIAVFLFPFGAMAAAGDGNRTDFQAGVPAVVDDTTTACNNQATVRYDFQAGQVELVIDTTATCTAAVSATNANRVFINSGTFINSGVFVP